MESRMESRTKIPSGSAESSYPHSTFHNGTREDVTSMQNIPYELFETIWELADILIPHNVSVSCRCVGNSFEIFSGKPASNITALSVHRRSREWAKTQYKVAKFARRGGYKGPFEQIESLYFNPRLDRICPINETEWIPEAVQIFFQIMKATKVSHIAISDCSLSPATLNSHWASFYQVSNIEHWSSSFRELCMYTTKFDLDVYKTPHFHSWEGSALTLNGYQKKTRSIQIFKARATMKKIKILEAAQEVSDEDSELQGKNRSMVDGIPAWLFEKVAEKQSKLREKTREMIDGMSELSLEMANMMDIELKIMVEAGSLDPLDDNTIDNASYDDDEGTDVNERPGADGDENSGDDVENVGMEDSQSEDDDEDEEPEEDEGIEDENSDDYSESGEDD